MSPHQHNFLSYSLPHRVFIWWNKNQQESSVWEVNDWLLKKSIIHEHNIWNHYSILQLQPKLCTKNTSNSAIAWMNAIITWIDFCWKWNDIFLKKIGWYPFNPFNVLPYIDNTWYTSVRTNAELTSFEKKIITSNERFKHCIFDYPIHQKKYTNVSDQITWSLINQWDLFMNDIQNKSYDALLKALKQFRIQLLLDNISLYQKLVTLENEVNRSMLLMPVWNHLHWFFFWSDSPSELDFKKLPPVLYNSKKEWFWWRWYIIEQQLNKWIYHFLSPKSIIIKTNKTNSLIIEKEYNDIKNEAWIILDSSTNKIMIDGKIYWSKDLPSQKATIEILWLLIQEYWNKILNTALPSSSYSKNKNSLVWKIIAPLSVLLKRLWKEEIVREVKWSLYEYTLCLPKQHTQLYYIKKLY